MNRVYISGPITKGATLHHIHDACMVWKRLTEAGIFAICPHWSAVQDMIAPMPHAAWMAYDRPLLALCNIILRLPGESVGADQEVAWAREFGFPVFHDVESLMEFCNGNSRAAEN